MSLVEVENVVRRFRMPGGGELEILRGVSLWVERGEVLAVHGPSGAGKSTLLHMIGLLDRPTSGEVRLDGVALGSLGRAEQDALRNRRVGFVFQLYHLMPELSALENVMVPLLIRGGMAAGPRRRAQELLDRLGLGGRLAHRPGQLSGGECQRVAIARALAGDPDLVLCDEPTGNLDPANRAQIEALLFDLNGRMGKTVVLITHDERLAARAHRRIHLVDGRVVSLASGMGAG